MMGCYYHYNDHQNLAMSDVHGHTKIFCIADPLLKKGLGERILYFRGVVHCIKFGCYVHIHGCGKQYIFIGFKAKMHSLLSTFNIPAVTMSGGVTSVTIGVLVGPSG